MAGCCDGEGYDDVFSDHFARRVAKRYDKRGLGPTPRRMVDFLTARGIEGASVLEIGGGVGEIQVELLRRGAAHVTNLEISSNYEEEARRLLDQAGVADRVTRRFVDIAQAPDEVEPADVVVLHRVVCCYRDYERLLSAAGNHARRALVFSHPPENVISRGVIGTENLVRRLKRQPFRAYVHPAGAMRSVLASTGLTARYAHRGRGWCVVGLER
jgi:magnesium-protoporphyrin O-methyltransferase